MSLTVPINPIPHKTTAALELYAVRKNSPEFVKYLEAVHDFFGLLREEAVQRGVIDVMYPKKETEPLRLIPFLSWVYTQAKSVPPLYYSDDYMGLAGDDSDATRKKMERTSKLMGAVQQTFKSIPVSPDLNSPTFPIGLVASVSIATVQALSPNKPDSSFCLINADQYAQKMEIARTEYTSFANFGNLPIYMIEVDKLFELLAQEHRMLGVYDIVLPKETQPFRLITFLKFVLAESNGITPQYITSDYSGVGQADTPISHQMITVHNAYLALKG